MKIAIDFDGTLWGHGGIEGLNHVLVAAAIHLRRNGHQLVLWTCRMPGQGLEEAVRTCKMAGLEFDAVNDNLPEVKMGFGDSRKIVADVYIDDRSLHPTSMDPLLAALLTKGGAPWPR